MIEHELKVVRDTISQYKSPVDTSWVHPEMDDFNQITEQFLDEEIQQGIMSIDINGIRIHPGNYIKVEGEEDEVYISKLISVYMPRSKRPCIKDMVLRVQYWYKKWQLNYKKLGICADDLKYICQNEVFLTNHFEDIPASWVISRCEVLSEHEFSALHKPIPVVYFMRAKYDAYEEQLHPKFEDWSRKWECQKPYNPDMFYIKCIGCQKKFHVQWVGLNFHQVDGPSEFMCEDWVK